MIFSLLLLSFGLDCAHGASLRKVKVAPALANLQKLDPWTYLEKFGYIAKQEAEEAGFSVSATTTRFSAQVKAEILKDAIKRFQRFARLKETGVADAQTVTLMQTPRCGVTDDNGTFVDPKLRFVLGGTKWNKNALTWKLGASTTRNISRAIMEAEIVKAFKLWSDVANLTFSRGNSTVDIDILFAKGNHGDGGPFDGPSGVLAHAFFPRNGDTHMDDDETWTVTGSRGINLLQVLAHEFGHALGLSHSGVQSALMAPFYRGFIANLKLDADDIAGIRALYPVTSGRNRN